MKNQFSIEFSSRDSVVIVKPFKPSDLDYRKTARTWWGRNVSSICNQWMQSESKRYPERTYKPGDTLFVFTKPGKLEVRKSIKIYGYAGYFAGDFASERDPNEFALNEYRLSHEYDGVIPQTIILAISAGYAKLVKYEDIDEKIRNEFQASIKKDRITHELIGKNTVIYENMEIHKYEWSKTGYVFSGYDKDTGNELPRRLVKYEDMVKGKFYTNKKEISDDPFL